MYERYVGRIQPGMHVCDAKGSQLGSVARVYRHDMAEAGVGSGMGPGAATPPGDEIVEVKRGPFGLGKRLYVPLGMINEVIDDSVFLAVEGFDAELKPYTAKPEHLAALH